MDLRRFLPVITVLALAGCNSPGVGLWGGASSKQTVGAHRFTVHFNSEEAEAYRTNTAFRLKTSDVFPAAARAMEQASGCRVDRSSVSGDIAKITARLIC